MYFVAATALFLLLPDLNVYLFLHIFYGFCTAIGQGNHIIMIPYVCGLHAVLDSLGSSDRENLPATHGPHIIHQCCPFVMLLLMISQTHR